MPAASEEVLFYCCLLFYCSHEEVLFYCSHEEVLLAARNPKQAFGVSREACERLDVDFSELSYAQLHTGDSMGCAEWAALTLDELRVRLVIGEWAPC